MTSNNKKFLESVVYLAKQVIASMFYVTGIFKSLAVRADDTVGESMKI